MTSDIILFQYVKSEFSNVYFQRFPQEVDLRSSTPFILLVNDGEVDNSGKDKTGRYEHEFNIEVIGTNYLNVSNKADEITESLKDFTDETIYLTVYERRDYDFSVESEVHRITLTFKLFINKTVSSS